MVNTMGFTKAFLGKFNGKNVNFRVCKWNHAERGLVHPNSLTGLVSGNGRSDAGCKPSATSKSKPRVATAAKPFAGGKGLPSVTPDNF